MASPDRTYLYSSIGKDCQPDDLISEWQSDRGVIFRQANLKKTGTRSKQEGVDVMLAVEAMQCAHKKIMKSAIIFSGDGDFIPLIDALVENGIFTTVVSFLDPKKGDVARRLRNPADEYLQIGSLALSQCYSQAARWTSSGTRSKPSNLLDISQNRSWLSPDTYCFEDENKNFNLFKQTPQPNTIRIRCYQDEEVARISHSLDKALGLREDW